MSKVSPLVAIALLATVCAPELRAASPEEQRGLEIAVEMDRRDAGWTDQQADMQMVLRNRQGQESRREIRVMFREIFRRMPDLRITGEPDRLLSNFIHGIKRMPCEFTPGARS